eukprot:TRINITY_DN14110_c0_g1_i1.p1 TRINITY_DN14110_c0_g1~~TRINITY_DN14110_c0_g1_i1.p1  ORF type:complete len:359 (-),score=100.59 TRINITY_DN14110_c0_g1_i1:43-1119(-)
MMVSDYVTCFAGAGFLEHGQTLAAVAGRASIKLYDTQTFVLKGSLEGHTQSLSHCVAVQQQPNMLASSSADGTARVWDVRARNSALTLDCLPGKSGERRLNRVHSCALQPSTEAPVLAVAVDQTIQLWDMRNEYSPLRTYEDVHTEDVLRVGFHEKAPSTLFSGSIDGLVCQLDLEQNDVDEAFLGAFPINDSVARFGFFGDELMHVTTGTERLSIWNCATGERVMDLDDIRPILSQAGVSASEYIVDCMWDADMERLMVLTGSYAGDICFSHLGQDEALTPLGLLSSPGGGHTATVRCASWDMSNLCLITGGEDSKICVWATEESPVRETLRQHEESEALRQKRRRDKKGFSPYGRS